MENILMTIAQQFSKKPNIVAFGSQNGGAGKTTTSFNFAVMQSLRGRKSVVIDLDKQHSVAELVDARDKERAAEIAELEEKIDATLNKGLVKKYENRIQAILDMPQIEVKSFELDEDIPMFLRGFQHYDDVIIDLPNGELDNGYARIARLADVFVFMFKDSRINYNTKHHCQALIQGLQKVAARDGFTLDTVFKTHVLINKMPSQKAIDNKRAEIMGKLGAEYLEFAPLLKEQVSERQPVRNASDRGLSVCELDNQFSRVATNEFFNLLQEIEALAEAKKSQTISQ